MSKRFYFFAVFFLFLFFSFLTPFVFAISDEPFEPVAPEPVILSNQKIIINIGAKELHLLKDDKWVKTYKIAVGEINHPSPIGERIMSYIVWNPWWRPPKDQEWAQEYQDTKPGIENPMGPVKMDIGDLYFIHGNNDPLTIGHAVTHGCVRLLDEDAISVANWILDGSAPNLDRQKFYEAQLVNSEDYRTDLDHPVKVDVIYDLVELKDGKIYVYDDVYKMGDKRQDLIQDELIGAGVPEDKIRTQLLKRDLNLLKDRRELVLDFAKYVKNFALPDRSVAQSF